MKRNLLFVLILPSLLFAQYNTERSTEQSFERSGLFFKSYFLNTFGMKSFKNVSVGLIDDPLLNLALNPANLPKLKDNNAYVYLDFRGDRTSASIVDQYVVPNYYTTDAIYLRMPIDPRWNSVTREEPEPSFSVGILAYPMPEVTKDFFVGVTYQIIHRNEKYYSTPYSIYNPIYAYAANGVKAQGLADVPVKDRYSSKDEMLTDAHLISAFIGYRITEKLNAGLSINAVSHSRTGGYMNVNNDEYGNTKSSIWENNEDKERDQDYHHIDFSAGASYAFSENFSGGVKVGILSGKAEQSYNSLNYYFNKYNDPVVTTNWSNSFSNSTTNQLWAHDGTNKYAGFNFSYIPNANRSITGYYKYTKSNEDLTSTSTILDTSNYVSQYIYENNNVTTKYNYNGMSFAKDIRSGTGTRNNYDHEAMINFGWKLTSFTKIFVGAYWNKRSSEIKNNEPVSVIRYSESHSASTGTNPYKYDNLNILSEDKTLVWEYSSDYWTVQIPVLLQFDINDQFGLMLGINRTLEGWDITDKTTAYFTSRERNENGVVKKEINFGERYTQPSKKITENGTNVITKFYASITPALKINLLLDPEFENQFRIAQWWLSFEAIL
jgi:hypothetical protein